LYPTVGLQTPGEIVEANFGQTPFIYDIESYIQVYLCFFSSYDNTAAASAALDLYLTSPDYHSYSVSEH